MHFMRQNSVSFRILAIGTYEGTKETRETDVDRAGMSNPPKNTATHA